MAMRDAVQTVENKASALADKAATQASQVSEGGAQMPVPPSSAAGQEPVTSSSAGPIVAAIHQAEEHIVDAIEQSKGGQPSGAQGSPLLPQAQKAVEQAREATDAVLSHVTQTAKAAAVLHVKNAVADALRKMDEQTPQQGEVIGQTPRQQGETVGQTPQQGEVIGQTPQQQGEVIGQTPQQGEVVGQTPQQQGEVIAMSPQQAEAIAQPTQQGTAQQVSRVIQGGNADAVSEAVAKTLQQQRAAAARAVAATQTTAALQKSKAATDPLVQMQREITARFPGADTDSGDDTDAWWRSDGD